MSIEEGIYTITNVKSGTALDLSGGDSYSIIGFDFHGQDNQQWSIQEKDCGYTIRGLSTGKFLSYEGGDLRDALKVVAIDDDEKVWEIYNDDQNDGAYRIQVPGTPFNVDLSNHGDATPGTPVELWGKWQAANQTWYLNKVD